MSLVANERTKLFANALDRASTMAAYAKEIGAEAIHPRIMAIK